jgi:hypothetical protein
MAEERDHSYLVTIPRQHGGSYSVMLGSGYFAEGEEDTEQHALASVTGSIARLDSRQPRHRVHRPA